MAQRLLDRMFPNDRHITVLDKDWYPALEINLNEILPPYSEHTSLNQIQILQLIGDTYLGVLDDLHEEERFLAVELMAHPFGSAWGHRRVAELHDLIEQVIEIHTTELMLFGRDRPEQ